jgi:[ribosomal protein S18]-alanine N-acetyltransferase
MTIRQATHDDIPVLSAIYGECFDTNWTDEAFGDFIESALVLVCAPDLNGFIIVRQASDEAEIITLAVRPNARRQGLAQSLLTQAIIVLSTTGCTRIFLEVAVDNPSALALYKQHDFHEVGIRKGYYRRPNGDRIDALVMERAVLIVANN